MLQFDVRLWRGDRSDCLQCARHAVVDLFDRIGMRNRYFAGRVPSNSNSRFHFTLGWQERGLYRNIKRRSISFYVKNDLILRMFAKVFQQRDRVVDRRLIESANDVALA